MKRRLVLVVLATVTFSLISSPLVAAAAQKPLRVTLEDLGILQLVAHDLFRVDRTTEVDHENGKLDLSTLFDHGEERVSVGGEVRNQENITVFTAAKKFADEYTKLVSMGIPQSDARRIVTVQYQAAVRQAFVRLLGGNAAVLPQEGNVTATENLAFRTIHDLIPGEIVFKGKKVSILDPSLRGKTLSKKELRQLSAPLDGQYDDAIRNIVIPTPGGVIHIDALERDSSFATQFNTDFSLEFFLEEVSDGRFDRDEKVTDYIKSMLAKGLTGV